MIKQIELFQKAKTELAKAVIGCAHNFASVRINLTQGNQEHVKRMIGVLTEKDLPIALSSDILNSAGLNYSDLCIQQGKLLVPKYLDAVVFQEYAPKSSDLTGTFYNQEGIAVVTELDRDTYFCNVAGATKKTEAMVNLQMMRIINALFVYEQQYFAQGNRESLDTTIKKKFAESAGISDVAVIETTNLPIGYYLIFRYLVKRLGILQGIKSCENLGTCKLNI
ncbi:hypothetical protein HYY69_04300 [Candidatus Woesearchaeota archaeon]|nr:hypothetical protein [Candidatus Woesearchaeota archaeon]